mmetsp:Transcript_54255/g.168271  ORF Transcript_54255/g.168271 Transcript_54255/m.168271 type:complete len:298 (-) Transcript_54255:623-1516(-)
MVRPAFLADSTRSSMALFILAAMTSKTFWSVDGMFLHFGFAAVYAGMRLAALAKLGTSNKTLELPSGCLTNGPLSRSTVTVCSSLAASAATFSLPFGSPGFWRGLASPMSILTERVLPVTPSSTSSRLSVRPSSSSGVSWELAFKRALISLSSAGVNLGADFSDTVGSPCLAMGVSRTGVSQRSWTSNFFGGLGFGSSVKNSRMSSPSLRWNSSFVRTSAWPARNSHSSKLFENFLKPIMSRGWLPGSNRGDTAQSSAGNTSMALFAMSGYIASLYCSLMSSSFDFRKELPEITSSN